MPSTDVRMGWNDEIDTYSETFLSRMSRAFYDWATKIIDRNGDVLDDIDKEIKELQEEIKEKNAYGQKLNEDKDKWDKESKKTLKVWQDIVNNEMPKYKTVANKYRLESENFKTLQKGTAAYREQEKRLKQFEPKYKKWLELNEKAEKTWALYEEQLELWEEAKKKIEKAWVGKQSLLKYVADTLKSKLNRLQNTRDALWGAKAKGMEQARDRITKQIFNRKNAENFSGMIANTIDNILQNNLYFGEFSEDNIHEFLERIFDILSKDNFEEFNLLYILSGNPKYYEIIEIDGKKHKVFDMNKIGIDDLMPALSGFFRGNLSNATQIALKEMKKKRSYFVREQRINEDGDEDSLYDQMKDESGVIPDDDDTGKKKNRGIPDEKVVDESSKNLWGDIERFMNVNINKMAKTATTSLMRQLPDNAYLKKIGAVKLQDEMEKVLKKLVKSCSVDIRHGQITSATKLRNFVKAAIGGVEDNEIFNIIYTIVRATYEYYIVSYMGRHLLEYVKNSRKEDAYEEMALIRRLDQKKDESAQALRDYSLVRYASRTHRIARRIVEKDFYEDPEEMFLQLMKTSQRLEDKIDFLLEDKQIPDGSGKYNQNISTRPIRNEGDFGA